LLYLQSLKVKAVPLHARQAERVGRGISLPILNCSTSWGWVVSTMPWLPYPWERDALSIVQEAGWASGLVWMGLETLTPTRVWTSEHPACSNFLYWLCYNSHHCTVLTSY